MAPSAACHSQPPPPTSAHSVTSMAQIRSKTPRAIHRWNVRWTELSLGNSAGSWFHGTPLRRR